MINSSNGVITLNPDTIRGEKVVLGELVELDERDGDYTHLVAYHGDFISGSTLLTRDEAWRLLAFRARIADEAGDVAARDAAVRDLAKLDGGQALAL